MHRLLAIVLLCLGVAANVREANAGDAWRVAEVKGVVRSGTVMIVTGTELSGDTTIETGAGSSVTLVRGGARFVIGENARVHLPATGEQVDVLRGGAVLRRAGTSHEEAVGAGTSIDFSAADVAPWRQSTTYVPPPLPRTATPSAYSSASSAPVIRSAIQDGAAPRVGGARSSTSQRAESAPALRTRRAADFDLPSTKPGDSKGLQLDTASSGASTPRRSLDEQVRNANAAFAEAKRQDVLAIDRQAAEQLLHKVKPQLENRRETEEVQAVADKAGSVMAAIIILQLTCMGLLALWRFTRQPKSAQAQPRWRTL